MKIRGVHQVFLALVKAGLWERTIQLEPSGDIDFKKIYHLSNTQSVTGLVVAGLEHVTDIVLPKDIALMLAGDALQLEHQNKAMNQFVASLFKELDLKGINSLLVKGQGIAQCYEKPLWRACGDVDLFLDYDNYCKAKSLLVSIAHDVETENPVNLHQAMTINKWCVELHGTLRSQISKRIDSVIDEVQNDTFANGIVRLWHNGDTDVKMLGPDNDVIFVFTHILQHFFREGIGLRQICDWSRLLWTYREEINEDLLEKRLSKMAILPEWRAFAALAVDALGMPPEAMPLYSPDKKWQEKADRILELVFDSGFFGHGRDMSYKKKYPRLIEYGISFWTYTRYSIKQFLIFPSNAFKGWSQIIRLGVKAAVKRSL